MKPKLGTGARFRDLAGKVKSEGYSMKAAKKIAAVEGRKKFGAKKMAKMAAKGRKRG